jgi:hypothetical protein
MLDTSDVYNEKKSQWQNKVKEKETQLEGG